MNPANRIVPQDPDNRNHPRPGFHAGGRAIPVLAHRRSLAYVAVVVDRAASGALVDLAAAGIITRAQCERALGLRPGGGRSS